MVVTYKLRQKLILTKKTNSAEYVYNVICIDLSIVSVSSMRIAVKEALSSDPANLASQLLCLSIAHIINVSRLLATQQQSSFA